MRLIEELPQAEKCDGFRFRYREMSSAIARNLAKKKTQPLELPVNPSGCARTEVYVKRKYSEKMAFLAPFKTDARHENLDSSASSSSSLHARLYESNQRKQASDNSQAHVPLLTKYRRMKSQPRKVVVGRSKIHQWGLFATEQFQANDMVIEYVGEEIRQKVADLREKMYESLGIGSCYMFRMTEDSIVDATKRGNIARFINHSCDPNCYSKVLEVDGRNKIIILARRVIEAGQEITYDYQFPIEAEKITCSCGAANCIGRMN
eukprot:TRINITY_DN6601_c0_g1_i8.p1 TRINITY_DN6601_c0_g1~~TRINITY_DN6601_c0_g1_i8.p1  ORF type:complete len:263 (-),score=63.36 TRINITY_DN6601_c0_g1_i8:78-866(-)